jgi:hypothetical protein
MGGQPKSSDFKGLKQNPSVSTWHQTISSFVSASERCDTLQNKMRHDATYSGRFCDTLVGFAVISPAWHLRIVFLIDSRKRMSILRRDG